MSVPPDIPGFYYDIDKKKYFGIRKGSGGGSSTGSVRGRGTATTLGTTRGMGSLTLGDTDSSRSNDISGRNTTLPPINLGKCLYLRELGGIRGVGGCSLPGNSKNRKMKGKARRLLPERERQIYSYRRNSSIPFNFNFEEEVRRILIWKRLFPSPSATTTTTATTLGNLQSSGKTTPSYSSNNHQTTTAKPPERKRDVLNLNLPLLDFISFQFNFHTHSSSPSGQFLQLFQGQPSSPTFNTSSTSSTSSYLNQSTSTSRQQYYDQQQQGTSSSTILFTSHPTGILKRWKKEPSYQEGGGEANFYEGGRRGEGENQWKLEEVIMGGGRGGGQGRGVGGEGSLVQDEVKVMRKFEVTEQSLLGILYNSNTLRIHSPLPPSTTDGQQADQERPDILLNLKRSTSLHSLTFLSPSQVGKAPSKVALGGAKGTFIVLEYSGGGGGLTKFQINSQAGTSDILCLHSPLSNPDLLYSGGRGGHLSLFDLRARGERFTHPTLNPSNNSNSSTSPLTSIRGGGEGASPFHVYTGHQLGGGISLFDIRYLSSSSNGLLPVEVFHSMDGPPLNQIKPFTFDILNPDEGGTYLLAGGDTSTFQIWNVNSPKRGVRWGWQDGPREGGRGIVGGWRKDSGGMDGVGVMVGEEGGSFIEFI